MSAVQRIADSSRTSRHVRKAKPGHSGDSPPKENPPRKQFSKSYLTPDDRGSDGQRCWLRFPTIGHEAETYEVQNHYRFKLLMLIMHRQRVPLSCMTGISAPGLLMAEVPLEGSIDTRLPRTCHDLRTFQMQPPTRSIT